MWDVGWWWVFADSLHHVPIFFAHKKTQVWVLTVTPETCTLPEDLAVTATEDLPVLPYDVRGWPNFERNVAELLACEGGAGQSILLIDEEALEQLLRPEKMAWPEVLDAFKANQEPPKVPNVFCDLLATKTFSVPGDLKMLQDAYTVVYEETMHTMRNLVYCDLGWGDAAAADLSLAVQACHLLVNIELEGNGVADEGCRVLFEAFAACGSLAQITLRSNRVGDVGAKHIAAQLPRCGSLEELDLSFNKIANAGAEDFIHMLEGGVHPSLKEVRLNNNLVGSSFRIRLASVALETHGSDFILRV
ncbi:NLRC3 [Symbiodinium natans]|uniref:NLRC3 protein n=1 Tax=Symbiodinium natans TaxID=878477 RepID=A0A812S533_9DINO|nr:NLRC3 [Symbiodinium natans]